MPRDRQITHAPHGHILANTGCWSPDGRYLVYDVRSDAAGSVFDGTRIERVNVETGAVDVLFESKNGACCGVPTYCPATGRIVFILGPEHPTADWSYAANRRQGVVLDPATGRAFNLDARDLAPPFTPGALRGGTHLHTYSPDGQLVLFTYQDAVLERFEREAPEQEIDLRNIGVSILNRPVRVGRGHPRNHDGEAYSVLLTRTHANPRPGSDEISRACEEAWVGVDGFMRADGTRCRKAVAFQGATVTVEGREIVEAYVLELPDDLTQPGEGPLEGTATHRPRPPRGVVQRRLTCTEHRRYPGIQGPRHWLRSAPDGSWVAMLMRGDDGLVEIVRAPVTGGPIERVTRNRFGVESAFSISSCGEFVAYVGGARVCRTRIVDGATEVLSDSRPDAGPPRPEACVLSPDGRRIAFVRRVRSAAGEWNQIFTSDR